MRDVAIEYGHCQVGAGDSYHEPRELTVSAGYARSLCDVLDRSGYRHTTQVLVDDKSLPPSAVASASLTALRRDCEQVLEPDCIVLESGLVGLLDRFLSETIDAPGSDRARSGVLRYRYKHGTLACSQVIALWHALRLGRLEPDELVMPRTKLGSPLTGRLLPCRIAVSILPRRHQAAEDAADRDLLARVSSIDLRRQVLRFYYPDNAAEAVVDSPEWGAFVRTVCEARRRSPEDRKLVGVSP